MTGQMCWLLGESPLNLRINFSSAREPFGCYLSSGVHRTQCKVLLTLVGGTGWRKGHQSLQSSCCCPAVSRVVTPSVSSKLWSLRMLEPSPQLTNNLKPGVGAHLVYFLVPWGQNFQQKKLVTQKKSGKMCFKKRYICLLMKTLKCSL